LTLSDFFGQTYQIVALAALGALLRHLGTLSRDDGETLANVVVSTTLPAAIFTSVARTDISLASVGLLVLSAMAIPLVQFLVGRMIIGKLSLDRAAQGVFLASTTVSNVGFFLFPLFAVQYEAESLGRLAVYDIGNSLLGNSFTYYLAVSYGSQAGRSVQENLKKVLTLPTLWAGILGLAVSLTGWELPAVLANVLEPLAQANVPLAMLTVGLFINLRARHLGVIALALFVKMGLGWALGQGAATLLGLEGLDRLVVTTAPAMPVGLIVLAYAAREGLDTEFAANLISLSILIGLIVTPLLLAAR
jgi:predicted permease